MKDIALITVLFDYPNNYTPTFVNKAQNYFDNEDIHILRFNGLCKSDSYYEKLYFYKIVKLSEYIEEKILGNYKFILFLDATDTNFITTPTNIIKSFESMNCSVLMGAEYGLWPPTNFTHLYEKKEKLSDKFYLNSGTYIGYTEKIQKYLKNIITNEYQNGIDDQGKWTIEYLLTDDIKLDQNCEIFFSTYLSKKNVELKNSVYTLINLNACIIHDNGPHNEETLKLTNLIK
jgi:hypothetical protein